MSHRKSIAGITIFSFILLSASLHAQAAAAGQSTSDQSILGRRLSIDLMEVSPKEAFGGLARSLDCGLSLDPKIQQPVTIRLENVTANTILTAICESISCQFHLDGKTLVIQYVPDRNELLTGQRRTTGLYMRLPPGTKFANAPLKSVLAALSKMTGVEIRSDAGESTVVSADVSGQQLVQAIHNILASAGLWAEHLLVSFLTGQPPFAEGLIVKLGAGKPPAAGKQPLPASVAESDQEKKLIKRVEPVYPEFARNVPVRGPVILEVVANEKGEVVDVKIVGGGNPVVQKPVYDAVWQWRYSPTFLDGRAVSVKFTVTVPVVVKK
jgi:TonB family protein